MLTWHNILPCTCQHNTPLNPFHALQCSFDMLKIHDLTRPCVHFLVFSHSRTRSHLLVRTHAVNGGASTLEERRPGVYLGSKESGGALNVTKFIGKAKATKVLKERDERNERLNISHGKNLSRNMLITYKEECAKHGVKPYIELSRVVSKAAQQSVRLKTRTYSWSRVPSCTAHLKPYKVAQVFPTHHT